MTAIDKVQYLQIGVQGENVAMNIEFDMTAWADQYPNATFSILFKPYNETEVSPQTSTYDSETKVLTWTVGAGATAVVGVGYTEVRAQDGENLIKKTRVIPTAVENSVSGVEVNPPAAYADWVAKVLNAGTACVALAHGESVVFSIDDDGHLIYTYTNGDDEPVVVDVGPIDAYAMAVAGGYEGTKTEFEQYVADVLSAVDDAEGSAADAAASAAEAAQYTSDAVHTWLEENIDPDSGYALDRTLTEPLEAAPADMVVYLKSAIVDTRAALYYENNITDEIITGGYIKTNVGIGNAVILTPTEDQLYGYVTKNCIEGEKYSVTGYGGNAPRLWAFIDINNKVLTIANQDATGTNLEITAPASASKVIINVLLSSPHKVVSKNDLLPVKEYIDGLHNESIEHTDDAESRLLTKFGVSSQNLYDPSTDEVGSISSAGVIDPSNTDYKYSDYIYIGRNTKYAVMAADTYTDTGAITICLYNVDYSWQGRIVTVGQGIYFGETGQYQAYIRIIRRNTSKPFMCNIGQYLLPYEPPYEIRTNLIAPTNETVKKSSNLFDIEQTSVGSISSDGTVNSQNTDYRYSKPIYIGAGNKFTVKSAENYMDSGAMYICLYNKDMTWQGRIDIVGNETYTLTMGTYQFYIRIVFRAYSEPFMCNAGESLLDFAPYGYYVDSSKIFPNNENIEEKKYVFSSLDIPNNFTSVSVEALDGTGIFDHDEITVAQIYGLYDDLMSQFPNYITKKDYGMDESNTYHIYGYLFKPERVPTLRGTIEAIDYPLVIMKSGIHGAGTDAGDMNESVCALYFIMNDICNHWKESETLNYLRWNITFAVLPLQNPWGFNNHSRRNSNLVDLNRNFPFGWSLGTYGTNDYGGQSPMSESESQAIKSFIEDYPNAICDFDFHTVGQTQSQANLAYCSMLKISEMYYPIYSYIRQMTYIWQSGNYPNLASASVNGYIEDATGNGMVGCWITHEMKIPSATVETFPNYVDSGLPSHCLTIMQMATSQFGNALLNALRHFKDKN